MSSEHRLHEWRAAHARGERPSELPYGVNSLEDEGFRLVPASGLPIPARLRDFLSHRTGLPLARGAGAALASGDGILALLEQDAFAARSFNKRTPVMSLVCWSAERLRTAAHAERRRLAGRLAAIDLLMYWSGNQTEIFLEAGLAKERLLAIPYGVDVDFYSPSETEEEIDVLAVGQDSGRDYATLLEAMRGQAFSLTIVCKPGNLTGLQVPANVQLLAPVDHVTYRALMRRASVVVVPTHQLAYPTGQSVALEASACGRCVVVTGTTPMREYFEDGVDCLLARPHDSEHLRSQLERALGDARLRRELGQAARRRTVNRFNTRTMWHTAAPHMSRVLENS